MKKYLILALVFCACFYSAHAQQSQRSQATSIKQYVTDETGTLSQSQIDALQQKLVDFEKQTSNQVVVYVIQSLGDESLEEFSYEIAEKNGIGQKGKDNGVLLFIALGDRKLRIEVGYGLEGALPDALCDQIIRKEITPLFKQGKYYEGIDAGVDAIIAATKGEYTQDKQSSKNQKEFSVGVCGLPIVVFLIFLFFGFSILMSIVRRRFGWGRRSGERGWWYTGGSGWGSGSSWSSGGSSFGGFSGGGGSFGGGGSSGSW